MHGVCFEAKGTCVPRRLEYKGDIRNIHGATKAVGDEERETRDVVEVREVQQVAEEHDCGLVVVFPFVVIAVTVDLCGLAGDLKVVCIQIIKKCANHVVALGDLARADRGLSHAAVE